MTSLARSRRFAALTLGAAALVLAGCAESPAPEASGAAITADAGVRVVSVARAASLLDADPAPTVVDLRTPQEFAGGHLDGAVLVDYSAPDFREAIAELPRDGSYVVYCQSGNRSAGARQVMAELGFTDVADIDGGVVAWTQQGGPLTS